MAFKRSVQPKAHWTADELTAAMVGIGMKFDGKVNSDVNIEDTLLLASIEGMQHDDLRVLAVLTSWLGIHSSKINADRLTRLVSPMLPERVRAFWTAFAEWQRKDARFRRIVRQPHGSRTDLLLTGTDFQIRRHGEDDRFADTVLRVPANVLRDRNADVLTPAELARQHRAYHYRVLIGPTYRADMFAALEADPSLTAAELARRTYGSFATAWQVKHDFALLNEAAA